MTFHDVNTQAQDVTPTVGTPVYRDGLHGFVAAINDQKNANRMFVIGGGAMQQVSATLDCVFDKGNGDVLHLEGTPLNIAQPWLNDHIARRVIPADASLVSYMVSDAKAQRAQRLAALDTERQEYTAKVAEFRESIAAKIPGNAAGYIVAELIEDVSDSQSDYWNGRTLKTVLLAFSNHGRNLFPEMRKAALNFEETKALHDADSAAEHRENYSMGGGTYLKAGSRYSNGWKIKKHKFYSDDNKAGDLPFCDVIALPETTTAKPQSVATVAGDFGAVSVSEHTHTKKGFQMWIVEIESRVERETYLDLLNTAKASGGWYSRKWGTTPAGFAFKDQDAANGFAAALGATPQDAPQATPQDAPQATPQDAPQATPQATGEVIAQRLEAIADSLEKPIQAKNNSNRATNTPRQRMQAANAYQDAANMRRSQQGLRTLAAMHRAGEVPAELAKVKTKKEALELGLERLDHSAGGYYTPGRPTHKPQFDTDAGRAFWELLTPKSPEEQRQDAIKESALKIANGGKIAGFFPTPESVVSDMVRWCELPQGAKVLEPNAGTGAIIDGILADTPTAQVTAFEINGTLCNHLGLLGHKVTHGDFMEHAGYMSKQFDAVIMNPPFERGQDVEHVQAAFDCLKPGGVLIAVMSPSFQFNKAAKFQAFRDFLDQHDSTVETLPPQTFKASGTNVNTVLVKIWN